MILLRGPVSCCERSALDGSQQHINQITVCQSINLASQCWFGSSTSNKTAMLSDFGDATSAALLKTVLPLVEKLSAPIKDHNKYQRIKLAFYLGFQRLCVRGNRKLSRDEYLSRLARGIHPISQSILRIRGAGINRCSSMAKLKMLKASGDVL